jgi:hypothetical protein
VRFLKKPVRFSEECIRFTGESVRFLEKCVRFLKECVRFLKECVRFLEECDRRTGASLTFVHGYDREKPGIATLPFTNTPGPQAAAQRPSVRHRPGRCP